MATSEALTKYYNCLRDSFNKIQVKDNKTALVNAALRPKIIEEFAKSKDVLISYLKYLRVFTLIYSEKFANICISIICPLFKEHAYDAALANELSESDNQDEDKNPSQLVHESLMVIFKSKPELIDEFIHSFVRLFPNIKEAETGAFSIYFSNALQICTYIRGEPLTNLVARILDRLNPPLATDSEHVEASPTIKETTDKHYGLIYYLIDHITDDKQLENISAAILAAFSREFLTSRNEEAINHLLLYICSKNSKLADLFVNLLWANFTDTERSIEERKASVLYTSSFLSRANYIQLDKVLNHLETASIWCLNYISETSDANESQEGEKNCDLYNSIVESMLYLITQRYREMYEVESINKLKSLQLDNILNSTYNPLVACNSQTVTRFNEVSTLYSLGTRLDLRPKIKRRKSSTDKSNDIVDWVPPFEETVDTLPDRISKLYRNYYNHRNFTVYRE